VFPDPRFQFDEFGDSENDSWDAATRTTNVAMQRKTSTRHSAEVCTYLLAS
jgi:hypothetical protein